MLRKTLIRRAKRFSSETNGSVSVEFVLTAPILIWAFLACYVFFDGYRQSAVNLKAAYTISDLISRETGIINDDYIDSMHELLKVLTRSGSDSKLRVTIIRWDEDDDRYYVDWSEDRGFNMEVTDAHVVTIADKLPVMPDNERVILVETANTFSPAFKVGIDETELENFVFTRPRFAPQVVFRNS